ncbi:hypothetical protein Tco_0252568, partial [Tanacetum coccineum]
VQEQSTSEDILACGVLPVQDFIKCVQHIPKRIVVIYILNFLLVFFQPPKIKSFIDGVVATPLEKIQEPQKIFVWEFEKGDFHHWLDLFNHFDTYFKKYIQPRKDLQLEDDFLEHDHAFPRVDVFHILHVVQIILENYTNKHFYSSYEYHLSSLLASTDVDWLKPVYMMSDSSFSLVRTYEEYEDAEYILIISCNPTSVQAWPKSLMHGSKKHQLMEALAQEVSEKDKWGDTKTIDQFL